MKTTSSSTHTAAQLKTFEALKGGFGYTNVMQTPKVTKVVLSVGVGSDTALKVKKAVETATGHKVDASRPDQDQWPGLIYLAVGINTD